MMNFNVHGWERLSGDNAEVVTARNDVLQKLREVTEPHRSVWETRLKSKLDHPYFSVLLEIFLHQFLKERGWKIEIEPELPGTLNKPDFVIHKGERQLMVEAKTVMGAELESHRDERLMQLADDLRGKLNRTVLIHPMLDLPDSLPNRKIAGQIEKGASEVDLLQEFLIDGEHQGQQYSLQVTILLPDKPAPTADIGTTIGQAFHSDVGHPVRRAIAGKASKYGKTDMPFLVAIWPQLPEHFSSSDDDLVTLYGDKIAVFDGNTMQENFGPNGTFNITGHDGTPRYSHISAVLFWHLGVDDNPIRLYHNPFAGRSIGTDVFTGIPQCTFDLATGTVQWSPQ